MHFIQLVQAVIAELKLLAKNMAKARRLKK